MLKELHVWYDDHSTSISDCGVLEAIQTTNIVEESVDRAHAQLKDEEACHISAVKTLVVAEKRIKELNTKLIDADRERKSAEVALAGVEKQVED
nr:hypothetical protein CFP56_07047 [Quercus suber]